MLLVDENLTTRVSPGQAYRWICNHQNYRRWYPGVVSVEDMDSLPHGTLGKTYRELLDIGRSEPVEMAIRVVETIENQRFVTESELGRWLTRMEVTLEPLQNGGTRLSWRFRLRNQFSLARLIFSLAAGPRLRQRSRQGLSTLENLMGAEHPL